MDDFNNKINDMAEKAVRKLQDGSKAVIGMLDNEKQKAEIRSEIGHSARDLSKAYEKLGREYYTYKVTGKIMETEKDIMDLIRTKEKIIELLNEKLDGLEKEG